ncbi:hypothetical protein [Hyphomicrobium sp. CS1BSMeth3]|uniref:hypothetical protein n=1 Tax=Hyphomicrobium sp. CS1BSMeth3 TaxID=1892844 RepID=UPI000931EBE1|nr:hypothetical protein [Hyphomicrobium sp. CS1BSMeth3]
MATKTNGSVRKLIEFDGETWRALEGLSRDRLASIQELADEAFRDLLRKHGRPVTLREALKASTRAIPANDAGGLPRRRPKPRGKR